jgi:hypothetical protein
VPLLAPSRDTTLAVVARLTASCTVPRLAEDATGAVDVEDVEDDAVLVVPAEDNKKLVSLDTLLTVLVMIPRRNITKRNSI